SRCSATRPTPSTTTWPRAAASESTAGSTGHRGKPRTAASARRWRSSRNRCSSSTVAEKAAAAVTASASSSRPLQRPATRTSARPLQTTTCRSDGATRRRREERQGPTAGGQASRPVLRSDSPEVVLLLQGQGRRDRLQEREPVAPVHLGAGQDPLPAHHRRVLAAPAAGRR